MKSRVERAAEAILEFNRIAPQLTSFASTLAGRSVRLQAGPTTETDGEIIYIRPPASLADKFEHRRAKCDIRGADWKQECPECQRQEELYGNLYHEIAHIAYGSFSLQVAYDLAQVVAQASATHGTTEFNEYIRAQTSQALTGPSRVYTAGFLGNVNEILISLFMGPEDARIERLSAEERPGIGSIFRAHAEIILNEGLELDDGSFLMWKDRHIEEQIVIAVLTQLKGQSLEGRFSEEVIRVVNHPPIFALLNRRLVSVADAAYMAVGLLGQLHKLGLFDLPVPPPPPADDESDRSDEDEGDEVGDNEPGIPGDDGEDDDGNSPGQQPSDADDTDASANDPEKGANETEDEQVEDETGQEDSENSESDSGESSDSDPLEGPEDSEGQENGASQKSSDDEKTDGQEGDSGVSEPESGDGSPDGFGGDDSRDGTPGSDPVDNDGAVEGSDLGPDNGDTDTEAPDSDGNDEAGRDSQESADQPLDFRNIEHVPSGRILEAMEAAVGHDDHGHDGEDDGISASDIESAINQCIYFDQVSGKIGRVRIFTQIGERGAYAWGDSTVERRHVSVPESDLGGSLARARAVFSKSSRDTHERNLRSGKIDPRTLGARAWQGSDDRLFHRRNVAEGISYEVVIGLDISGSTTSGAIFVIKQAGEAMASLLSRLNIPFSMYAHSTPRMSGGIWDEHLYEIKTLNKRWNDEPKTRLATLRPAGGSLDGHNLQFYRKILDRSQAKNRLCLYFTDGQIPATSPGEEGPLMRKEVLTMEAHGHKILGVGVGTDSPKNYGLDTVAIHGGRDIVTLVKALEDRLTGKHRS